MFRCYLEVEFAPRVVIFFIDQLECVGSVPIHVSVTIGSSSIAEQEHHLMSRLWTQTNEVPEHVRILQ